MKSRRFKLATIAIALALLAPIASVSASELRVPMTIDYVMLREAIKRQLYTSPGGRAELWKGVGECQFLDASAPALSRAGDAVRFETGVKLSIGMEMGGRCVSPIEWSGIASVQMQPYIPAGLRLQFHVKDLDLLNPEGQRTAIVSRGFDLVKQHLIPRLEAFSYDLNPAVRQLGLLAEEASTPVVAERIRNAIATVRADRQVIALNDGVRVTLAITLPEFPTPVPGATPAEPTAAELAAFQKTLDNWDAFLVFTVKQLGETVGDKQFRNQLLAILLESRFKLVAALSAPEKASEPDPVRTLFLEEWQRLHDLVRSAAERGRLGARALDFLSFVSAGDALLAFDQAAPALGMRISAQDLRRLAHVMAPNATGDPLAYSFDEDKELRKLFDMPQPLEAPVPIEETEAPPIETPTPSIATPPTPAMTPTSTSHPSPIPTSMLDRVLESIAPCEADAEEAPPNEYLIQIGKKLGRIIVDGENVDSYREQMGRLLELTAERELGASTDLDPKYARAYRALVKSSAWQESCWRQFVNVNGRIRWLESSTGDIGLMQVNKHVWRGFYSLLRLRWDVVYNAGAGSEILMKMIRYTLAKPVIDPVPIPDHLARSAYAAYNGGPDAYNRWRRDERAPLKQIDESFWIKYQATKDGQQIDILACARHWGKPH